MQTYSQATAILAIIITLTLPVQTRAAMASYVSADKNQLMLDGKKFIPRGVAHFDLVSLWMSEMDTPKQDWLVPDDYKIMKQVGFNSVRLSVKADYFIDGENSWNEDGFTWLDQNINAAKNNGIKVLLDMHLPAGGKQQDYQLNSNSEYFWSNTELKVKQILVWQEIAKRYADEPAIWGYELMNEPATLDFAAYETLFNQIAYAIRNFDRNHVLVIDAGMRLDKNGIVEYPYATVNDINIARAVHFYDPIKFTLQGVEWGFLETDMKSYPSKDYGLSNLKSVLKAKVDVADPGHYPVVLTEFGTVFQSKHTGQANWIRDVAKSANEAGIGWHYWYFKENNYPLSMGLKTVNGPVRPLTWSYLKALTK